MNRERILISKDGRERIIMAATNTPAGSATTTPASPAPTSEQQAVQELSKPNSVIGKDALTEEEKQKLRDMTNYSLSPWYVKLLRRVLNLGPYKGFKEQV